MRTIYFLNLTNGLEFLERMESVVSIQDIQFIRLPSTACEQKLWDEICYNIDNNFLMNLALGNECIVVDYSSKHQSPRAIWQGLNFVYYTLNRLWFDDVLTEVKMRNGFNASTYFDEQYHLLSKKTKKRLLYFKRFTKSDRRINLKTITGQTDLDGKYDEFVKIVDKHL